MHLSNVIFICKGEQKITIWEFRAWFFVYTVEPKKPRTCKIDSDCLPGQICKPRFPLKEGICVTKSGKLLTFYFVFLCHIIYAFQNNIF